MSPKFPADLLVVSFQRKIVNVQDSPKWVMNNHEQPKLLLGLRNPSHTFCGKSRFRLESPCVPKQKNLVVIGNPWEGRTSQNIQIQDLLGQHSLTPSWMVCSTQALKWQSLLLSQRPSTIAASSKVPKIVLSCFWHQRECHHCNHSWWHLSCCLENCVYFGSQFWFQKDHWMEKLIWDWMCLPWLIISPIVSCLQRRVHRDQQTWSNAGNLRTQSQVAGFC